MASYSPAYYAVVSGKHVDVKININLKGGKHDNIKLIYSGASPFGAGVILRGDLMMKAVVFKGVCGHKIKALNIKEFIDEPFLVKLYNGTCNAPKGKTGGNPFRFHLIPQKPGYREGRPAGSGLKGKPVGKITRSLYHLGG